MSLTPLTLNANQDVSATLATANQLVATQTGTTNSNLTTKIGTSTGWVELWSQGNTTITTFGSIQAPTGHGWFWDAATLVGNEIPAGTWQFIERMRLPIGGTATVDIVVRAYKYNGGVYTSIGSITLSGQALTSTSTAYTSAVTSLAQMLFSTAGDKVYLDKWVNITVANANATATIALSECNNVGAGLTGTGQMLTPGYTAIPSTTALTTYLTTADASGLTTANQLYTTAGTPTTPPHDVIVGTGTGYGELTSNSATASTPDSPYGVVYFYSGSTPTTKGISKILDLLVGGNRDASDANPVGGGAETGLVPGGPIWFRGQLRWDQFEQIKPASKAHLSDAVTYNAATLAVADDMVSRCNAANVFVDFCIQSPPQWRRTIDINGNAVTPDGYDYSGSLTTAIVAGGTSPIHVSALGSNDTLSNGQQITLDYQSKTTNENVQVSGNYSAGATSIAVVRVGGGTWTASKAHATGVANSVQNSGGQFASATDTANYVKFIVARYNGTTTNALTSAAQPAQSINAIQWNEDYDTPGTTIQRSASSKWFVTNWQTVGPLVRLYGPNIKIVGPAVRKVASNSIGHIQTWYTNLFTYTPPGSTWAGAAVDGSGNSILDAGDFHYYRDGVGDPNPRDPLPLSTGADTPTQKQEIATIQAVAAANGFANFDVWCTETGWDLYDDGTGTVATNTPAAYADYLTGLAGANGPGDIGGVYEQHRLNGGSHVMVWALNPNSVAKLYNTPPTADEPKSIVDQEQSVAGGAKTFTKYQPYTAMATYMTNHPQWTSGGWGGGSVIGAPSGNGWLLDSSLLDNQQLIAGTYTGTLTLKAVVSGGPSGSLVADLHYRLSRLRSGVFTTIVDTTLAGQTINSTGAAYTTTGTGALTAFQVGDRAYEDIWPKITSNANANALQAIRIQKLSSDTTTFTGDAGTALVTPGFQAALSSALSTSPTTLSFAATAGGASPASQTSTLSETAGIGTAWTSAIAYGSGSGWLATSPTSGTLAASGTQLETISCTTGALAAGTYTATITYTATNGGAIATVGVTFVVSAPVSTTLATSPTTLTFLSLAGGAPPAASKNSTLSETGGTGTAWTSAISYDASGSGWLSFVPSSGTLAGLGSQVVAFSCTTPTLAAGVHTATVTFTATTGGRTATVVVTLTVPFSIQIAGTQILFDEDTFQLHKTADEHKRCQFTILDYAGTQQYSYRQQVLVTDATRGALFSGYVIDVKQNKTNMYPSPGIEHEIDSVDHWSDANKRTSNKLYGNQQAGVVAVDQVQRYLASEGVTAAAALDWDELLTDWQAGTLAGTVATTNAYDSNPGDGDLELSLAGSPVTVTESTTATFNTGTLTNVVGVSNSLQLTSHSAFQIQGTSLGYLGNNGVAYANLGVWQSTYSIVTGDSLQFSVWIASTSPEIKASIEATCSDGTVIGNFSSHSIVDQNGIGVNAIADLTGYANDQWYARTVDLSALNGKTLSLINLGLAGQAKGQYTAFFYGVKIVNGGTTKLTVTPANGSGVNYILATSLVQQGYTNTQAAAVTAYDPTGTRVSTATSVAGLGNFGASQISYAATTPTSLLSTSGVSSVVISTSLDGGATWQAITNLAAIPSVIVGAAAAGISLKIQEVLSISGPDPTIGPTLTNVLATLQPTYVAAKTDFQKTVSTQTQWNAGTLTGLTAAAGGVVSITNAASRTWDDASIASQTLFGSGVASQASQGRQLKLTAATNTDARARLDFAGTYAKLDMSITVVVPTSGFAIGLEFGTTTWNNGLNSYAYFAYTDSTHITLARGTNGGANSLTNLGSTTLGSALTPGDLHTLRVRWGFNANQIDVYLDGVTYISVTDATYTAAGNVAARFFNPAGTTQSGFFDNFYVVKSLDSLSYVSQGLSLTSVGTAANNYFAWQASVPNGSTIAAQTSIDNGATYQNATNGGQIAGIAPGTSLATANLKVKFTVTSNDPTLQPTITAWTAWIASAFSASGTRISPSLSLAAVGRAGTALVNWNAFTPPNTSVAVATSLSGGTFQAVSIPGGAITGITVQPQPYVDSFAVDSSANFTQTNLGVTGGGAATFTWDTANSRLTAVQTTGIDGVAQYTAPATSDANVQAIINSSDSGGLVVRMVDTTHCYLLSISDGSAASSPNTASLYKVAGTGTTLLASASIAFVRGMYHIFTLDAQGSTLVATMDGITLFTVTNTAITAAGLTGILAGIHTGDTLQCYGFRSQPYGDNVSAKTLRTKVTLTTTDPTVTPQLLDMQAFVSSPAIGAGTIIPATNYVYTFVDKNFDDLATQSNFMWLIDQSKAFAFQGRQALPAPWALSSNTLAQPSDLEADSNLLVENAGDMYRNRQILKNVIDSATFTDDFVGDTQKTSFNLRYPIAPGTLPVVKLNGQMQTVGLSGTTGSQWYYTIGSTTIAQDSSGTVLTNFDKLVVPQYTGTFIDNVVADNEIAQAALAVVEGGSGIVESVIDVSSLNMSYAAGVVYANQLLIRYCVTDSTGKPTGRTITFKTYRDGLAVGQSQPAFVPEEHLSNVQLLIRQIDIGMQTQPGNTVLYNYVVQSTELPNAGSWSKLFASGLLD